MPKLTTIADFDRSEDIPAVIDHLVEAGVDRTDINVLSSTETTETTEADANVADPASTPTGGARVAVTADRADTTVVKDILQNFGEIDLEASETPAVGWAGDPEGANRDKSKTPALGWSGETRWSDATQPAGAASPKTDD